MQVRVVPQTDFLVGRQGGKSVRTIAQHQLVFVRFVLEEVEDALFLPQTLHEAEVAFLVLHAVVPGSVRSVQQQMDPVAGDLVALEDLLSDIRGALLLEDAGIAGIG